MKNRIVSIIVACLLVTGGFVWFVSFKNENAKATDVSGTISTDTTWDLAGSPYIVVGDVTVLNGVTLTIDPGVEVRFNSGYSIFVDGTLTAIGTETDTIIITSNLAMPAPADWQNIQINLNGYAEIKFCNITYGDQSIYLYSSNNIVSNNNISNSHDAISVWGLSNIITNNDLWNNGDGIQVWGSSNSIINNNVSIHHGYSISFWDASDNTISNNRILNNAAGIYLFNSVNTIITNNTFENDGIEIRGNLLEHFNTHSILENNKVNGKPMYYYKDTNGFIIDGIPLGQLILANCSNVNVKNLQIEYTDMGIEVAYSTNISITNNNLSNTLGIYLYSSSNNIITNNIIRGIEVQISGKDDDWGIFLDLSSNNSIVNNNVSLSESWGIMLRSSSNDNIIANNNVSSIRWYGIYAISSGNNFITNNNVSKNEWGITISDSSNNNIITDNYVLLNKYGISLVLSSSYNIVTGNNVSSNTGYGIWTYDSSNSNKITNNMISNNDYGVHIYSSSHNNITNNNISSNSWGIYLELSSNNNIFRSNLISNNNYGIYIAWTSDNIFYHNNIINNTNQAFEPTGYKNQWNDSYPSGGNYWSDYGGIDMYNGPNQDILGSDGIGDTPYVIDSDSQDEYPLWEPFKYFIILKQGWNLISVPFIQENQNLTKVLERIDGYYDAVQWYDITDSSDPWKHFKIGKSLGNDLSQLNETIGFWIHITQPGDTIFFYNGTKPIMSQSIPLHIGWNQVGYPSLTTYNRTIGLNTLKFGTDIDCIQWYDASTKTWHFMGSDDVFVPGRGYWIHSKVEKDWVVPV